MIQAINNRLKINFGLFFVANVISIILFLLLILISGNGFYQRLIGENITGKQLNILQGQGNVINNGLQLNQAGEDGFAIISTGQIDLSSELFAAINIHFDGLDRRQALALMIHYQGADAPLEVPIITNGFGLATFDLGRLLPNDSLIYDIWVVSPSQIDVPFTIENIELQPKVKTFKRMLDLIGAVWSAEKTWTGSSINMHGKLDDNAMLNPKTLVFTYAIVVFICFFILLLVLKKPKQQSLWLVLILAWLLIDSRFFYEQIRISEDSFHRYHDNDEKANHAMVAPDIFTIADKVATKMSENTLSDESDKQAKIWLAPTIDLNNPQQMGEHSDYIIGRLNYFLVPNALYAGNKLMPKNSWRGGGFYLLILDNSYFQYQFEATNNQLDFADYPAINAKRLINEERLQLFYVMGDGA